MGQCQIPALPRPVCLPRQVPRSRGFTDYSGQIAVVTGWGCSSEAQCQDPRDLHTELKEVPMPVIDNDLAMCW